MSKTFNSLKEKIVQYISLRLEDFRLEVIERIVNLLGYFIFTIFLILFLFIILIFSSFGLAEWLSSLFDSHISGYFATAGIFVLLFILVALNARHFIRFFAGKMITILTKKKSKRKDLKL